MNKSFYIIKITLAGESGQLKIILNDTFNKILFQIKLESHST